MSLTIFSYCVGPGGEYHDPVSLTMFSYCLGPHGEYHDPDCEFLPYMEDVTATFHRNNYCYKFVNKEEYWQDAQNKCSQVVSYYGVY